MGWVVLGIVLFCIFGRSGGCGHHRHRRYHRREEHDASDYYRMQASLEDMKRRMQVLERNAVDGDEWLRREFRNL